MMRRWHAALLLLVPVAIGATIAVWPPSEATRRGWLADFDLLERHVASAYANLEDRIVSRTLSPKALDAQARTALGSARSLGQAQAAIGAFAAAFEDNHFKVRPIPGALEGWLRRFGGADAARGPIEAGATGADACRRMGAKAPRPAPLDWEAVPGFAPLGGQSPFPAGLLPAMGGGSPIAVLRVPTFLGERYPALCEAVWRERAGPSPGPCDEACQEDFSIGLEVALLDAFSRRLEEINARAPSALVVDITGNGGGTSVADPMARLLTAAPLQTAVRGFVRHVHWARRFERDRVDFEEELARPGLSPQQRGLLAGARDKAEAMHREALAPCDLSGLWRMEAATFPCHQTVRSGSYLRYAAPGELDGLETRGRLFEASQYPYREGVFRGRLLVLVDADTASAAEQFTAMLKDNGAARVVGAHTFASGCGYTNEGIQLTLEHLRMTVKVPDCIRLRADGTNEAEGIEPDVRVPWAKEDSPEGRARKAAAVLTAL